MKKIIPPKLYKYQSLNSDSRTIENLQKRQIWFSKPASLNDPFDCAIPFTFNGTDEEYQELYDYLIQQLKEPGKPEKIKEIESRFLTNGKPNDAFRDHMNKVQLVENQKKIDHEFSQMGVACFSQRMDSLLMWSHYADGHKGLCLEFDTNFFPFADPDQLHQVVYGPIYPTLSPTAIFHSHDMPFSPLITKSNDWTYEMEWRLITDKGNESFTYEPKALTAIYFGCSMLKETMDKIAAMPAKSAPRLYQMQRSRTEFKLEYIPYHM